MSEYIHCSAVAPRANPRPGLVAPLKIGLTMCGKEYFPRNPNVVTRKAKVTCPDCIEAIEKSSMVLP